MLVFGSSEKTIHFGDLKPAMIPRQCAMSSASVALLPGFSSMKAQGT